MTILLEERKILKSNTIQRMIRWYKGKISCEELRANSIDHHEIFCPVIKYNTLKYLLTQIIKCPHSARTRRVNNPHGMSSRYQTDVSSYKTHIARTHASIMRANDMSLKWAKCELDCIQLLMRGKSERLAIALPRPVCRDYYICITCITISGKVEYT